MAIAHQAHESIFNRGVADGIILKLLTPVLDEAIPRTEHDLLKEFSDIDAELNGDYTRIMARKGAGWVYSQGRDFAELHRKHVTALAHFGDTFELSREYRNYIASKQKEIDIAAEELGARIFEDVVGEFMNHNAVGNFAGEDASQRVWQAAFGTSPKHITRQSMEVVVKEVKIEDPQDTNKWSIEQIPSIQRVWGVISSRNGESIADYERMFADFDRTNKFVESDAVMCIVVPADFHVNDLERQRLEKKGIFVIDFPMTMGQFYEVGYSMLADPLPTADSPTPENLREHITKVDEMNAEDQAARRRFWVDKAPKRRALYHATVKGGDIVTLKDRLAAAYPPEDNLPEDDFPDEHFIISYDPFA